MKFKTAIFDMDGVIIDSEKLWDAADTEFFDANGREYVRDQVAHIFVGMNFTEVIKLIKKEFKFKGSVEELAEQRRQLVIKHYKRSLKFVPGYADFHDQLRKIGIQTCIATSSAPEFLDVVIQKLKLERFGDRIFKIADVGYKSKPDPAIFLYAAKQMNSRPDECFVIEDSPKGIEAAHNAGMKCIGITTTFRKEILAKADVIVDRFAEIDLKEL